jgi:hypothetical protein
LIEFEIKNCLQFETNQNRDLKIVLHLFSLDMRVLVRDCVLHLHAKRVLSFYQFLCDFLLIVSLLSVLFFVKQVAILAGSRVIIIFTPRSMLHFLIRYFKVVHLIVFKQILDHIIILDFKRPSYHRLFRLFFVLFPNPLSI